MRKIQRRTKEIEGIEITPCRFVMEFKIMFGTPLNRREVLNIDLFLLGFLDEIPGLLKEGDEASGDEEEGGDDEEDEGKSLKPSSSASTSLSLSRLYSSDSMTTALDSHLVLWHPLLMLQHSSCFLFILVSVVHLRFDMVVVFNITSTYYTE